MKCPICDKEADSPHHIKSRAEGGTDDPRNLINLCKKCHNDIEGLELTPELLERKRSEKLGQRAISSEEYWYIQRPEGLIFIGIKKSGKPVEEYGIFFPYLQQGNHIYQQMPIDVGVFPGKVKVRQGRPSLIIDKDLVSQLRNQRLTQQQIANRLGISRRSVSRILLERK